MFPVDANSKEMLIMKNNLANKQFQEIFSLEALFAYRYNPEQTLKKNFELGPYQTL